MGRSVGGWILDRGQVEGEVGGGERERERERDVERHGEGDIYIGRYIYREIDRQIGIIYIHIYIYMDRSYLRASHGHGTLRRAAQVFARAEEALQRGLEREREIWR